MQEDPEEAFVKVAAGPDGMDRLRAEADILRRAAHPGVVQLLESGPGTTGAWTIRLVRVPRGDLGAQGSWSLGEVAGYGAAVATTVADLHDLGIVHRRLTVDHLLVDDRGRPVLCGFGQATMTEGPRSAVEKAEDTTSLARTLRDRMPSPLPRRVSKILDRAAGGPHRRPLSARQLAAALTVAVPAGRLPMQRPEATPVGASPITAPPADRPPEVAEADVAKAEGPAAGGPAAEVSPAAAPGPPTPAISLPPTLRALAARRLLPGGQVRRRPVLVGAAVAVFVLALAVVFLSSSTLLSSSRRLSSSSRAPTTGRAAPGAPSESCPVADGGCRAVRLTGSTLSTPAGRFHLDAGRDMMVLGRWACSGPALPALLQPDTGQVWVFLRWATAGRPSTAHPVGTVPGARSLRVLPAAGGCDRLAAIGPRGRTIMIRLPRS
jgi:serine/threonine protein kinase